MKGMTGVQTVVLARLLARDISGAAMKIDCRSLDALWRRGLVRYREHKALSEKNTIVTGDGLAMMGDDAWTEVLRTNLDGTMRCVRAALRPMIKQKSGSIVAVSSVAGIRASVGQTNYAASKGAVLLLSKSIALDYAADGVRCNCICPGITDTPMLRYHLSKSPDPEATLAERLRRVPMGVVIQPVDIAKAALYLSCEDSSGVTGTSLVVDGGYLAAAEWATSHTRFMQP